MNYELTDYNEKKMKRRLLRRCTNEMTQFRQIKQKRFATEFQKLYENDFRQSKCDCVWFYKLSWKFFCNWRLISDVEVTDVDFSTS